MLTMVEAPVCEKQFSLLCLVILTMYLLLEIKYRELKYIIIFCFLVLKNGQCGMWVLGLGGWNLVDKFLFRCIKA